MILVDTSAFIALASDTDVQHTAAVAIAGRLRKERTRLATTPFIVMEACAVLQRKSGFAAADNLLNSLDDFEMIPIGPAVHAEGVNLFRSLKSSDISLVDCVTFCIMRSRGIKTAFAFDKHFIRQGFLQAS